MNASTKFTIGPARKALRTSGLVRNALRASLAAVSLSVSAVPALARPHDDPFAAGASFAPEDCPSARTVQRGGISLSQATAIAQSRVPGRVVSAKTVMSGDRVIHEIRILGDDGRVRTVRVDAQSGAVM
jgi:Peptidase propeptide and YPEB domain